MGDTRVKVSTPARAVARWLVRHPRSVLASAAVSVSTVYVGYLVMVCGAGVAVVAGVSWRLLDRPTFDRFAGRLLRAWWRTWWVYRRQWARVLFACSLTLSDRSGQVRTPRVLGVRSLWCWDSVRIKLLQGQTIRDFEDALPRLADAYRARRATARTVKPGVISLDFQTAEPFDELFIPVPALPSAVEEVDLSRLVIGRDEYGRDFALDLVNGLHHLFAGSTGAGKGSFLWGLLRQLAPLIRAGLVRLWVIDPKGGMEFGAGREMFHAFATNEADGLALMNRYMSTLDRRKAELGAAGVRSATLSAETPLELLICDELAAMTELAPRSVSAEFEPQISKALTQYRAVLGRVVGAVQEPTKSNVPFRGLFPTKIALRLDESSYVDMCLGEGLRDRGALADQIPDYMPGVAYVKRPGVREPLRVRAAYTTATDTAELVEFCTSGPAFTEPATVTPLHRTTTADEDSAVEPGDFEFIEVDEDDDGEDVA